MEPEESKKLDENVAEIEDENSNEFEEEITLEESVENTEEVLNTLIDLLVEKGIIKEEEFQKKLDEE